MEKIEYLFGAKGNVRASARYTPGAFGFVTEAERRTQPDLAVYELNNGFRLPYWYVGEDITTVEQDAGSCYVDSDACVQRLWEKDGAAPAGARFVPLCFKADLPQEGNYCVTVELTARCDEEDLLVFLGCRHLFWRGALHKGERLRKTFTLNVSAIIPEKVKTVCRKPGLDVAIVGHCPSLTRIAVEPAQVPTLYLAGDSTMTDDGADYPYNPAACYAGWGQAFDACLNGSIALCNQAHNGRTTETFRTEGHYDLVMQRIRPGDFMLFQFGHNDQKHPHLQANNGYPANLERFIAEVRAKGAYPLLATPVARNTWKDQDGTLRYNDLLHDHAEACFAVGRKLHVPVLDMHEQAMAEILRLGRDASIPYYHVGDWTHTNDYGALRAAGYAAKALQTGLTDFPAYKPLADAVQCSHPVWPPVPAPLLEKPVRFACIPAPDGEENTDHAAEKAAQDSLAQLESIISTAKATSRI